jgi:predicted HAD superfamily Cof-like phosphohydrolase
MSKSNFQKVIEFNKAFGISTNTDVQYNIFDKDPKLVEYRLDLINEEVQEFKDAIDTKNMTEILDSIGDIMYVVLGAATCFGFDADKVFDLVHKSNMSKLCETEQDAIETVKRYKEDSRYDSPSYRKSDDNIHWIVYNKNTMKILKSYKYSPVDFTEI